MNVRLIATTAPRLEEEVKTAEELIVYCARVSNPSNQTNMDTAPKLLRYCIKHGHWSIFEQASMTVEITTSRAIAQQILRHRSFSYQEFCISGDSEITILTRGKSKKRTVRELHRRWGHPTYSKTSGWATRVFDEGTRSFIAAKIVDIRETGVRPVFRLTVESTSGRQKTIKATLQHRFLTPEGFSELGSIHPGSFVGVNGVPAVQDPEWLAEAKKRSLSSGAGLPGIAEEAGVTTHTVRKWLRKHSLQFTRKEVASYTAAWNRGLPAEEQPRYGAVLSEETRSKMREASRRGGNSPFYRGGRPAQWRVQVWQFQARYRHAVFSKTRGLCALCRISPAEELDHVLPVASYPTRAFDPENLQPVCRKCHRAKTALEHRNRTETVRWWKVVSVVHAGEEPTYDMEIDHPSHNYVANGIVTHNSQRYAVALDTEPVELRLQGRTNRQGGEELFEGPEAVRANAAARNAVDVAFRAYQTLLDSGVAKECARFVLPLCTQTRLYMTGSVRSWIHYLQVRCDGHTQKEHRLIAEKIREIFSTEFPNIAEALKEQACSPS